MEKVYLSVKDVANIFEISKATVYKLIKTEVIPHKRIGKKIVIHRDALEKCLISTNS